MLKSKYKISKLADGHGVVLAQFLTMRDLKHLFGTYTTYAAIIEHYIQSLLTSKCFAIYDITMYMGFINLKRYIIKNILFIVHILLRRFAKNANCWHVILFVYTQRYL